MNEVREFAEQVRAKGEEFDQVALAEWGETVILQMENFDMDALSETKVF